MNEQSRIRVRINLCAISSNIDKMYEACGGGPGIIAVLKDDGYGHGAVEISKYLEDKPNVWGFAVATGEEALELRSAGIEKPILLLGAVFPGQFRKLIDKEIRLSLFSKQQAECIISGARTIGKKAYVHLKIDTGMGRLGYGYDYENLDELTSLLKNDTLITEGVYSHLSRSDEKNKSFCSLQLDRFNKMIDRLSAEGISFKYHHISNSAGIIDNIGTSSELVRTGISMYGLYPSDEVNRENIKLAPALSLLSSVIFVKEIQKDTPISYGGTFVSQRRMTVATIPVGYGDGYPRSLSNKGYVLIHGKKAPILGRVCMDLMMVDVSDIENVIPGDKVTLIGTDGDETISVDKLSDLSGRFNYEFVCDINKRVPREYIY